MSDSVRTDIGPFAIMPRWIFGDPAIDGTAIKVLGVLASYADRDGTNCRPLQTTLAHDLQMSVDTIQRAIKRLEQAGIIETTPRLVGGRKIGNNYLICYFDGSRKDAVSEGGPETASGPATEAAPVAVSSIDQTTDQTIVASPVDKTAAVHRDLAADESLCSRVIERIVDARLVGRTPRNMAEYRKKVRAELEQTCRARLVSVIETHPGAPDEMYAAFALGEPTPYLAQYRCPE